jgi:hypothetical protein
MVLPVFEQNTGGFRWGYVGEDVVAVWEDILTLRATRDGELKALEPMVGAAREIVEKTRRGAATAFLRARQHKHSLHASAVEWKGRALLFVGDSGAGKSTTAERLCRRGGVGLLSDDLAAIEPRQNGWHVLPSEAVLWLEASDSRTKTSTTPLRAAKEPASVRCIVSLAFIEKDATLEVKELRGAEAVAALLPSLVRFDPNPIVWERELDVLSGLVSQAVVLRATRSRDVPPDEVANVLVARLMGEADERI